MARQFPDPSTIAPLFGHVSPETAYLVEDYPYGFRLRCKIRYWIETNKHGSRVVSQTTNPKRGDVWNKPKASTYTALRVLYIDKTTGHVENDGLGVYASAEDLDGFLAAFGAALTSDRDKAIVAIIKKLQQK